MFDYAVKKVVKRMSKSNLRFKKNPKKSGRSASLKKRNPSSKTNLKPKCVSSFQISNTHSGSQRWGPSAAFSGQCADSLCGTKHRTRHTGSTVLGPAGAACIGVPRTVPLPLPPRPRKRRRSWMRRRQRRWKRTMKRMERGAKAFEEEGVSWVVLVADWIKKNR